MTGAGSTQPFYEIPDFVQLPRLPTAGRWRRPERRQSYFATGVGRQLAYASAQPDVQLPGTGRTQRHALPDGEPRIANDGAPITTPAHHLSWRVNWANTGRSSVLERVSLRCLALLLAIIRKATANDLTRSGRREAAKQSGISKHIGYVSSSLHWITASVPHTSARNVIFPAISIYRHLPVASDRQTKTGNSGWISTDVRRMPPSTVSPGTAAAGANRARWLNIRQYAARLIR